MRERGSRMRRTWDAAARTDDDRMIGKAASGRAQLESLFAELGAEPHGEGTCLEIGCGVGRMTEHLAAGWPQVIGVDVSPAMIERARERLAGRDNVELRVSDGERFEGVSAASIDTVVCFGVVQHLPTRQVAVTMLDEIARVLRPGGEAFVQLPLLQQGVRARLWRAVRSVVTPVRSRLRPSDITASPEYRGMRLTRGELGRSLPHELQVVGEITSGDTTLYSTYPHARDVRLRLRRR
jgi:SAM-dependent methyltransferase